MLFNKKGKFMKNCLNEEKQYEFTTFNADVALKIGEDGIKYCKEHQLSVCIDITAYSKTLFHYCFDDCSVNNEEWIRKKRNTVLYFQHSTKFLSLKNNYDDAILQTKYGLSNHDYCLTAGGFPIKLKDSGVVGSICISGLAPDEDHDLVIKLLAKHAV